MVQQDTNGKNNIGFWNYLNNSKCVVFEDSAKGLISTRDAVDNLFKSGISIDSICIGVTNNAIKKTPMLPFVVRIVENINQVNWNEF